VIIVPLIAWICLSTPPQELRHHHQQQQHQQQTIDLEEFGIHE